MIKLLIIFIIAIIIITISSKLLLGGKVINILIGDYQIILNKGFLVVATIFFIIVTFFILLFLFKIIYQRKLFFINQKNKNFDKTLNYLTNYIIHNATSDYEKAGKIIKKLDKNY